MNEVKKINALGYTIEETQRPMNFGKLLIMVAPSGARRNIALNTVPVYVGLTGCKSVADAEAMIKTGKGYKTTGDAIYRDYYSFVGSDDDWIYQINYSTHFSRKTYNIIADELAKLHVVGDEQEECDEPSKFIQATEEIFDGAINSSDIVIGMVDDCWVAEYWTFHIDSALRNSIKFSVKPSLADFWRAQRILKIRDDFWMRKIPETFTCQECGRANVFWRDAADDIIQAADNAGDKYCGC